MAESIVQIEGTPIYKDALTAQGIDLAHQLSNLIDELNNLYAQRANAKNMLIKLDDELDRAHLLANFLSDEVKKCTLEKTRTTTIQNVH